eukprot:31271-Amphidinium_carterae.2
MQNKNGVESQCATAVATTITQLSPWLIGLLLKQLDIFGMKYIIWMTSLLINRPINPQGPFEPLTRRRLPITFLKAQVYLRSGVKSGWDW